MASITESKNPLTGDMDVVCRRSPAEFVTLLRNVDLTQLFSPPTPGGDPVVNATTANTTNTTTDVGYVDGIMSLAFIDAIDRFARATAAPPTIATGSSDCGGKGHGTLVVFGGAGTSGRLAYLCAHNFQRAFDACAPDRGFKLRYLIAGGDRALIASQESAEDNALKAREELHCLIEKENPQKVVYVGITCGLSAPYVAGQVKYLLELADSPSGHPDFLCSILGFNHPHMARKIPITGVTYTFSDIVTELLSRSTAGDERFLLLTPIYGPEALTGSTRMKGGSATKIILDTMMTLTLCHVKSAPLPNPHPFKVFQHTAEQIYTPEAISGIASGISLVGRTLNSRGKVIYLAASSLGLVTLIDASECVPTYGAHWDDVRAFVPGGWGTVGNAEGDMASCGESYKISMEDFTETVASSLTAMDTVIIFVCADITHMGAQSVQKLQGALHRTLPSKASVLSFVFGAQSAYSPQLQGLVDDLKTSTVCTPIPLDFLFVTPPPPTDSEVLIPSYLEFAAKLVANALTTGGFTLAGKVYHNIMIDLRVSNVKLVYRAVGIIESLTGVSRDIAQQSLLRCIYEMDAVPDQITQSHPSAHVEAVRGKDKIVPLAVILSVCNTLSLSQAQAKLAAEPVVRSLIESLTS
ncbi:glucokinase regulatory protein [Pelomyxa schiedti]|nr:glucokinase regulatory protein [Pelomyxa schiedti]